MRDRGTPAGADRLPAPLRQKPNESVPIREPGPLVTGLSAATPIPDRPAGSPPSDATVLDEATEALLWFG